MRIAIATVQVPFIHGGAEILTSMLEDQLRIRGYNAETVSIPFKWSPPNKLLDSMMMGRMIDLSEVCGEKIDEVIAMKFPAFYTKHENKVLWLMHQHRQAYDLWGTKYGDLDKLESGESVRKIILENDNKYIQEAKAVYTIAENTSARLRKYNGIESEVLYHPPLNHEKLACESYGDYIFYASRIDSIKRQRHLVEAAKYLKTDVKIVIAGGGADSEIQYIRNLIRDNNLENRVTLTGFISEEEKINYYANCLAVYFGAFDEDYGYITLEGFFSRKPVIVHDDSGGPLEFVENDKNGFVIGHDPETLANKIDMLYENRALAEKMGKAGFDSLTQKNISWDYVISKLVRG